MGGGSGEAVLSKARLQLSVAHTALPAQVARLWWQHRLVVRWLADLPLKPGALPCIAGDLENEEGPASLLSHIHLDHHHHRPQQQQQQQQERHNQQQQQQQQQQQPSPPQPPIPQYQPPSDPRIGLVRSHKPLPPPLPHEATIPLNACGHAPPAAARVAPATAAAGRQQEHHVQLPYLMQDSDDEDEGGEEEQQQEEAKRQRHQPAPPLPTAPPPGPAGGAVLPAGGPAADPRPAAAAPSRAAVIRKNSHPFAVKLRTAAAQAKAADADAKAAEAKAAAAKAAAGLAVVPAGNNSMVAAQGYPGGAWGPGESPVSLFLLCCIAATACLPCATPRVGPPGLDAHAWVHASASCRPAAAPFHLLGTDRRSAVRTRQHGLPWRYDAANGPRKLCDGDPSWLAGCLLGLLPCFGMLMHQGQLLATPLTT